MSYKRLRSAGEQNKNTGEKLPACQYLFYLPAILWENMESWKTCS